MDAFVSLLGAAVILTVLRDLFHTLWHPTRRGGVSRVVMTLMWRAARLFPAHRRVAGLAGPLAMVTVVGLWAMAIVLGWALVYVPHMPEEFTFSRGLEPTEHADLLDSVYFSLVTVGTLGFGDIAPTSTWLRIVAPLEALIGFALLTATVSWVLEIYPALTRRRALALRLATLRRATPTREQMHSTLGAVLLENLAADLSRVRIDFSQYPESYYFHDGEHADLALAALVGYAAELARDGRASDRADVRLAAAVLTDTLEELATTLDQRFLHTGGTPAEVFAAFARDHDRTPHGA
ncbi:potassium channel family protein [Streptomyces sp. JJ36]|uniref:potassium channel family protein n=1 Tax=Streptomyces sp. JJ36 TaxID=2736645 RepID=UPI001F469B23|nr:potassium channel family protein [Streptomyces sp. JJ36]MCF6522069.1 two pore domain potassium channel family protein [Streptomyces sp. JJ36]